MLKEMFSLKCLVQVLILLSSNYSFSQFYRHKKFTIEDGLFSNEVSHVFQDSRGFIWVQSGWEKVCRFDGKDFKTFSVNSYDQFSETADSVIHFGNMIFSNGRFKLQEADTISNLMIFHFADGGTGSNENTGCIDKWGGNWKISNSENRYIYRYFKGRNIRADSLLGLPAGFYTKLRSFPKNKLQIYTDRNKNLWLNSNLGLYLFNGHKFEFSGIKLDNVFAYKDKKNRIWLAYNDDTEGFMLYENNKLIHFDKDKMDVSSLAINIFEDANGTIWANAGNDGLMVYGKNGFKKIKNTSNYLIKGINRAGQLILTNSKMGGVYTYDDISGIIKIASVNKEELDVYSDLICDREDNIWACSYNGLHLITKSNIAYKPYTEFGNFDKTRPDIRHLFTTSQGVIYLLVYEQGIFRMEKDSMTTVIADRNLYPEDVMETTDGSIWITMRTMDKTEFEGLYKIKNSKVQKVPSVQFSKHCDTKQIGIWPKLIQNKNGNVCLLSRALGVFLLDEDDKTTFYPLTNAKNEKVQGDLIEDQNKQNGIFYYNQQGNSNVIVEFDPDTKTYKKILEDKPGKTNFGYCIKLKNKLFLFGSQISLAVYDGKHVNWYNYNDSLKMLELRSKVWLDNNLHIWYLTGDAKATMHGGGFTGLNEIYFDEKGTLRSTFYNENDGLSSSSVSSIFLDNSNSDIWISAGGVLNKLNKKSGQVSIFDFKTLGGDNTLNDLESANSLLYSFSTLGIVMVDYSFKTKNMVPPLVHIVQIGYEKVNEGQTKDIRSWSDSLPENLILNYTENNVFFEVRGLSFTERSKVQYKYILEGYDEAWSKPTSLTFIKYTNLPEGNYTLKVLASNNDDVWSSSPAVFSFKIKAPWYRTWIAYLFYITALVALILGYNKFRSKQLLIRQAQLERTVTEKTAELVEEKKVITSQKHLIEEKHKEITDSINYAERIQRSFIATKDMLDTNLADYFVLFKSKDIVSGDFYCAATVENGNFILVTADSTGHGVPGAIMSLLNITSIEKAMEKTSSPSEILNLTRQTIIARLKLDGTTEGGKDGMDCSLIKLDAAKRKLRYSAANNPVWIVRQKNLIELLADKMPVGKHDRDTVLFSEHEVDIHEGDIIYTLTDGFPDQFGGPKGKKFMYKQLKELLLANSDKPMSQQKIELETVLNNWMSGLEQVDDITLIGIRV